jgi:hypothetical protein
MKDAAAAGAWAWKALVNTPRRMPWLALAVMGRLAARENAIEAYDTYALAQSAAASAALWGRRFKLSSSC